MFILLILEGHLQQRSTKNFNKLFPLLLTLIFNKKTRKIKNQKSKDREAEKV